MVMEHGSEDYSVTSYKILVTKMGYIITRMQLHEAQPIQAEDYLCDEIKKKKTPHESKGFNKLIDIYATLYDKQGQWNWK